VAEEIIYIQGRIQSRLLQPFPYLWKYPVWKMSNHPSFHKTSLSLPCLPIPLPHFGVDINSLRVSLQVGLRLLQGGEKASFTVKVIGTLKKRD